jgi:sugar phosphate isomerase/epimerase
MQLCLNSLMWRGRSLPEALEAARVAGVSALELAATPACPHLRPLAGHEAVRELSGALEGWRVLAVMADHPDLARREEEGGEEAVEHTVAAVKAAKALGAPVVSTSLGGTEIDAWDTAWERALGALRLVLRETSRTGVRLAVELHADDVLDSLKKARRLLQEIPNPRLGLTLDTAFLYYRRIQLSEALEAAGERVYHVHLRDATRSDPYRAIGRGEVSFPAVFRALRAHGYDGALSVELRETESRHGLGVDEALAEAVPRLREWLEAE